MKNDNVIVGLVIFFIAGFYLGPLIENSDLGLKVSDFAGALATLIAAYFGARFAFNLNERKKKLEEELKIKNNIHKFLAKLFLVSNDLLQIEKQYLLTAKKYHSAERHLFLMPLNVLDENKYNIDLEDINFIMHPKYFDIFTKIIITIESYKNSKEAINDRSKLMRQAQLIFDRSGVKQGQPCEAVYLSELIGPSLNEDLKICTDASIEFTESTLKELFEIKEELRNILSKMYPDEKFIDFERPVY